MTLLTHLILQLFIAAVTIQLAANSPFTWGWVLTGIAGYSIGMGIASLLVMRRQ